jgi:hypothetical protein
MNQPIKILLLLLVAGTIATIASFGITKAIQKKDKQIDPNQNIKIQKITSEVDHGLNKVTIDDTTVVLIYRGVESCTMIQIK